MLIISGFSKLIIFFFIETFSKPKTDSMFKQKSDYLTFSVLILAALFLSACGTTKTSTLFGSSNRVDPASVKDIYVENDQGFTEPYYRIKEGDVISIRNLQNQFWGGNSGTANMGSSSSQTSVAATNNVDPGAISFIVDNLGMVTLPSLDQKVKISGLTRTEAKQKIEDIFISTKKLDKPIIELNIVNLQVNLLGEFIKPGPYPLKKDNTTLIDIVTEAGGLTKNADPRSLVIHRGREKIYVNLESDQIIGKNKLIMQNGDLIIIGKNQTELNNEKIQRFNTVIQPILVVVNLVILVFTLTK